MSTVLRPGEVGRLKARLEGLTPESPRRWGRMTAHQMVCHLADSFRWALGERTATPVRLPLPTSMARIVALRLPLPWPKGAPTAREMDQEQAGTPPGDFQADVEGLAGLLERFARTEGGWPRHPLMGEMGRQDWGRWAYRHTDHHLRQFGA